MKKLILFLAFLISGVAMADSSRITVYNNCVTDMSVRVTAGGQELFNEKVKENTYIPKEVDLKPFAKSVSATLKSLLNPFYFKECLGLLSDYEKGGSYAIAVWLGSNGLDCECKITAQLVAPSN